MITAKPTRYKDVNFRSRLEARWAAFFDLTLWPWKYEPCDLPVWTPDFSLAGSGVEVLAEVKPIQFSSEPADVLQRSDIRKVLSARTPEVTFETLKPRELLLLGDGPQRIGPDWVVGVFLDESWGAAPDWAVLNRSDREFVFDFASRNGSFALRMSGAWDGDHHLNPINDNSPERAWRLAGNAVQWRSQIEMQPIGQSLMQIVSDLKEPK